MRILLICFLLINSLVFSVQTACGDTVAKGSGDFDFNGLVDVADLKVFTQNWLSDECETPVWCSDTDINRDGSNNIVDFGEFANRYGRMPWNVDELYCVPQYTPVPEMDKSGAKAIYYDGLDFQGRNTRVFAWYGQPQGGGDFPAMVVVHGGGGTANAQWVADWNARGYAAISMDTTGSIPEGNFPGKVKDTQGGPDGWGGFEQIDWPHSDQWSYHAAANVVRAHSILRSLPGVNGDLIGIVGISWGGYLTSLASGIDSRFAFAIPIYGCGYLYENSGWNANFTAMGRRKKERWTNLWDPSMYLSNAAMPMLWVNGTNDFAFPLDSYKKSYSLVKGEVNLAIKVRLIHNHNAVTDNREVYAFADSICKGASRIPTFTDSGTTENTVWAAYNSPAAIASAVLVYTTDSGIWKDRYWNTAAAQIDAQNKRVTANLPTGTKVWYFNITDSDGNISSCRHSEL